MPKCRFMRLHAWQPCACHRLFAGQLQVSPGKLSSIGVVFVFSMSVVFVGDGVTEQLITEKPVEYLEIYTQNSSCTVAKQESRVPAA